MGLRDKTKKTKQWITSWLKNEKKKPEIIQNILLSINTHTFIEKQIYSQYFCLKRFEYWIFTIFIDSIWKTKRKKIIKIAGIIDIKQHIIILFNCFLYFQLSMQLIIFFRFHFRLHLQYSGIVVAVFFQSKSNAFIRVATFNYNNHRYLHRNFQITYIQWNGNIVYGQHRQIISTMKNV